MWSVVSQNSANAAETDLTAPEVEVLGTYDTGVGTSDSASEGKITERRIETRPAPAPGRSSRVHSRRDHYPAQRRRQSQPVFPARFQSGSRHRLCHRRGWHAGEHADPCPWAGLCGPELPDTGTGFGRRLSQRTVLRRSRRLQRSRCGQHPLCTFSAAVHRLGDDRREPIRTRVCWQVRRNVGGGTLLYGIELVGQNGPWENPEHFKKFNRRVRYSRGDKAGRFFRYWHGLRCGVGFHRPDSAARRRQWLHRTDLARSIRPTAAKRRVTRCRTSSTTILAAVVSRSMHLPFIPS